MKRIGRIFCSSFLSVLLVLSECPTVSAEDSKKEENVIEDIQRITEFVGYEPNENKPYMNFMVNAEEKENLMLPESLDVWIENSSEPEKVMVNWDIKTETYDQIVYVPKWDETLYQLSDELLQGQDALPYIVVNVENQMQNNELIVYDNNVTEKTVGSMNADYTNFIELFNDSSLSGDVIVKLNSDVTESRNASTGAFEIPDRITSLTIDSDTDGTSRTLSISGNGALLNIYVNGKKLYVGKDIKISNDGIYNSDIYGGGYEKDIIGSPEIEFYGRLESSGSIYGGGYNHKVTGDIKLIVGGYVGWSLIGGGHAEPDKNQSLSTINADVTGNIEIQLLKDGHVHNVLYGGGYVMSEKSDTTGTHSANVSGNINLDINGDVYCLNDSIVGGGVAIAKVSQETSLYANVGGNITLTFGADASRKTKTEGIPVHGGGRASSYISNNTKNIITSAKVGGDIKITAIEDSLASSSQEDDKKFQYLYGGGNAAGRGADASVQGNTYIQCGRVVRNSAQGIYGGGHASYGGTADVIGTAHITIVPIKNQVDDYENAQGIYGGGKADGNYDSANQGQDLKVSQANVGGSIIKIEKGIKFSDTDNIINLLGGGYIETDGFTASFVADSDFKKCTAFAKVLGDIKIDIADDITLPGGIYSAGYVKTGGDASVSGSITLTVGKNSVVGNYTGGGYAYGGEEDFYAIANVKGKITVIFADGLTVTGSYAGGGRATKSGTNADVAGGLDYTINGDFSCKNYYGAGYLYNSAGSANIGTEDNPVSVKTTFKGDGTNTLTMSSSTGTWAYNGGFAQFGKGTANIYGDVSLTFDGTNPQRTLVAGGYGYAGSGDIIGSLQLLIKDLDNPLTALIYSGGYAANGGTAVINGDVNSSYDSVTINNFLYGGGRNADAKTGTDANIQGNVRMTFKNSVLPYSASNTYLNVYGGGYGTSGNPVNITGTSVIELKENNTVNGKLTAGGYASCSVNDFEFHIIGTQKNAIAFTDSVYSSSVINNKIKLYVGDGTTETTLNSLFLQNLDEVIVADKATLNLAEVSYNGGNNTNRLFYNVGDLTIQPGGSLDLTNANTTYSDSILGNYTGGGTLRLEDGKTFTIGGTASGTTTVEIDDTPIIDQTYITVTDGGTESFTYDSDEYELRNDEASAPHQWKYVKSEIVAPHNSVTGIVNDSEYTIGDKISFTAIGDGMNVTSPQTNAVRWLPVKWQVLTENSFNEAGPYTGEIDTSTLSVGSNTLKVVFQKQKYDGSVWNDVTGEDTLTITFKIKEKSSSDLPSGGGGGGSSAPSSKADGFVEEQNKTYYYNNGKQVESGFILLDKDEKLVAAVKPEQLSVIPEIAEAVYFIKNDKTVAKQEWVILDEFNNLVNTRPFDQLITDYSDKYKVYAAREDGRLVQSWLEVNGIWYYFKEDYTARYQYWQAHWNDWYLFENYTYVTNRWHPTSEGRWYYLDSEGRMVRNQWVDDCWINEDGIYWSPLYN
ncbi:hypothetical protein [Dielma fastidiosa]|uniref:hypothetical protein n=1 Tax=Dielma fastidiosa TaxID=1034346 RepID=UPI003563A5A0